jgi:hypothetical protein
MKEHIRWIEIKNGKCIVRRFDGIVESETVETITFMYNKRLITRKKSECIFM